MNRSLPAHHRSAVLADPRLVTALRGAMFVTALLLVWISTSPFFVPESGEVESGNAFNQIVFSLAGLAALASLLLVDPRALAPFLHPVYLLTGAWLAVVGVVGSTDGPVSQRAFSFTAVVVLLAAVTVLMPRTLGHFAGLIGGSALVVLALCYAGVIVMPSAAVHSGADLVEPEHAGSWRGLFDHKNTAGPMMVSFLFVGLFVARARSTEFGWAIAGLALLFLLCTGSKTSIGLTPLVLAVAALCARTERFWLRALLCLGPLAVLLVGTIGTVLVPALGELREAIAPGLTYTGRTDIWHFAFEKLAERPFTGFGLEAFWGSDLVRMGEATEGESGIAFGMVHGHNGYLDVVVSLGVVGLVLVAALLVALPLLDYHRRPEAEPNRILAQLYLQLWLFALYSACLESFFFRRADPVWFTMLLAVLGLRLSARFRVAS